MNLKVKKLNSEALLPTRNKPTDAGLDLYALEDTFIPLGETRTIDTGVAFETPVGFVTKIEDRSSLASKGLRTGAGVIDSGYTGPIKVVIHNLTNKDGSMNMVRGYIVHKGDKIAQALVYKVETPMVTEVSELASSDRNEKGFGSSGR